MQFQHVYQGDPANLPYSRKSAKKGTDDLSSWDRSGSNDLLIAVKTMRSNIKSIIIISSFVNLMESNNNSNLAAQEKLNVIYIFLNYGYLRKLHRYEDQL